MSHDFGAINIAGFLCQASNRTEPKKAEAKFFCSDRLTFSKPDSELTAVHPMDPLAKDGCSAARLPKSSGGDYRAAPCRIGYMFIFAMEALEKWQKKIFFSDGYQKTSKIIHFRFNFDHHASAFSAQCMYLRLT